MTSRSPAVRFVAVVLWMGSVRAAAPEVLVPAPAEPAVSPDAAVDAWLACRKVQPPAKDCAARRSAAVEILVRDFHALGARANFAPLPILLKALRGPEPELRAAAADGIGMIGPRATETAALAAAFNDPVPAVRASAATALYASNDERAKALAGRAVGRDRWKGFEAERAPDVAKLRVPAYAGASALRFATDLPSGCAMLTTGDSPDQVLAFYAAKSKRKAMTLDEFAAAFEEKGADEESGDGEEGEPDMAAEMAKAMAMMTQMNEQMNAGKSIEEAAAEMGGSKTSAESAASTYADETYYGSPKVVVLEESSVTGQLKPVRYVVVYQDLTLGKTGIALHAPPVMP